MVTWRIFKNSVASDRVRRLDKLHAQENIIFIGWVPFISPYLERDHGLGVRKVWGQVLYAVKTRKEDKENYIFMNVTCIIHLNWYTSGRNNSFCRGCKLNISREMSASNSPPPSHPVVWLGLSLVYFKHSSPVTKCNFSHAICCFLQNIRDFRIPPWWNRGWLQTIILRCVTSQKSELLPAKCFPNRNKLSTLSFEVTVSELVGLLHDLEEVQSR